MHQESVADAAGTMKGEQMKKFVFFFVCALAALTHSGAFAADVASVDLGVRSLSADETYWTYPDAVVVAGPSKIRSVVISLTKPPASTDEIILPGDTDAIKVNTELSSKYSKLIKVSDSGDSSKISAYLRTVRFKTVSNPNGQQVKIVVSPDSIEARTFYCEKTQHYYQHIGFSGYKTWTDAYNEALKLTFFGRKGYLATVTSEDEDLVICKMSDKVGYLGGTVLLKTGTVADKGDSKHASGFDTSYWTPDSSRVDRYNRNINDVYPAGFNTNGWYWACGPEFGEVFFSYPLTTSSSAITVNGAVVPHWGEAVEENKNRYRYFNWNTVEPNWSFGEPILTTLKMGTGCSTGSKAPSYSWNNLYNRYETSNNYTTHGYFVEFGNLKVGDDGTDKQDVESWGESCDEVPSIYHVEYHGKDGIAATGTFSTGEAQALASVASLKLSPPDAVRTNFFGWAKSKDAGIPDLIDGQLIQDYAPALSTVVLYPVWTELPVVKGKLMTRGEAEIFEFTVVDFNREEIPLSTVTDGGAGDFVYYAFSADEGVYGIDITQKATGYGAYVDFMTVTGGVQVGRDYSDARVWDIRANTTDGWSSLNTNDLVRRISQIRGGAPNRRALFSSMPILDNAGATDWAVRQFAKANKSGLSDECDRRLYDHPEVWAEIASADAGLAERMKNYVNWKDIFASSASNEFISVKLGLSGSYCYFRYNEKSGEREMVDSDGISFYPEDSSAIMSSDEFVTCAIREPNCRLSTAHLPWRLCRYYKDSAGVEHYDVLRTKGEDGSLRSVYEKVENKVVRNGDDLQEWIEVREGYALIHFKRFGQFAFIDPTKVALDPGGQVKASESTWGWPDMKYAGYMKYDKIDIKLFGKDLTSVDKIAEPTSDKLAAGWGKMINQDHHQVYQNKAAWEWDGACVYGPDTDFSYIVENILAKVRLSLANNPDDAYWRIELTRMDGFNPYTLEIGVSNALYTVVYRPGAPDAGTVQTNIHKNVRIVPSVGVDSLPYVYANHYFYYWAHHVLGGGASVPFLDDGQSFFDISKAFQTNFLDAVWSETPVIRGSCLVFGDPAACGVELYGVGAKAGDGYVLHAGLDRSRYVVTAKPGVYDVVFTDADKRKHTELVDLPECSVEGPDFCDDVIVTAIDNSKASSGLALLAGGLRDYSAVITGLCERVLENAYVKTGCDSYTMPEFTLLTERSGKDEFKVRAKLGIRYFSSLTPAAYMNNWPDSDAESTRDDPAKIGQAGYEDRTIGTNFMTTLIVPYATAELAGCRDVWAIERTCEGADDVITTTPNENGESVEIGDGYLRLNVLRFGTFKIAAPDIKTTLKLGEACYTNDYGVSYFGNAAGSGDVLFESVKVYLTDTDGDDAAVGVARWSAEFGAAESSNLTATCLWVRFAEKKTADEIADFLAQCVWFETDYSFIGGNVKVELFADAETVPDETAAPDYTSETAHIPTRAAVVLFRPGEGAELTELGKAPDSYWVSASNTIVYLPTFARFTEDGFWTEPRPGCHFYGWEVDGKVRYGDCQQLFNRFRNGETNIFTAIWTNMPVVAGCVTNYSADVKVTATGFSNVYEAAVFEGGTEMSRYAVAVPAGWYDVEAASAPQEDGIFTTTLIEIEDSDVKFDAAEEPAVTSRVKRGAQPTGNVLAGGLDEISGEFGRVVLSADELDVASGAYRKLAKAVGTKAGTYFNLSLAADDGSLVPAPRPVQLLLPFDSSSEFDETAGFFKVYRYDGSAAVELDSSEYELCDGYLRIVTDVVSPIAIGKSEPIEIEGAESGAVVWFNPQSPFNSSYAQLNLVRVKGDFDLMQDVRFFFEDRVNPTNASEYVARLWPGRICAQSPLARNPVATTKTLNGVVYRYVELNDLRDAMLAAEDGDLVKYGVSDATMARGSLRTERFYWDEANADTAIQIMFRYTNDPGQLEADQNSVLGFLSWTTGGQHRRYLALATDGSAALVEYEEQERKLMKAVGAENACRMLETGPISSAPSFVESVNLTAAVGVYVDGAASPYCRIVDFAVDASRMSGRIEVGADEAKGSVGSNVKLTLLAAESADGKYEPAGQAVTVGADGSFSVAKPANASFFKIRLDVGNVF